MRDGIPAVNIVECIDMGIVIKRNSSSVTNYINISEMELSCDGTALHMSNISIGASSLYDACSILTIYAIV